MITGYSNYLKNFSLVFSIFLFGSCQNEKSEKSKYAYQEHKDRYQVAFLIMEGVYNTELTAPFDIFHHTRYREGIKAMDVFLVANTKEAIYSFEGIRLLPDFDYTKDALPPIDILVVPSAEHHLDKDLEDHVMLEFVKKTAQDASYVISLCDGAFVLAKAGILENSVSTTFPSDVEAYRKMFPQLDIRDRVSFVHDGKMITSQGGAKSFDPALYLCEKLYGPAVARRLAQGLVIDWNSEAIEKIIID